MLGVSGTYWGLHCAARLVEELNRLPLNIGLNLMDSSEFQNALRKYAVEGLQLFTELGVDSFEPDDFKTVRAALRSPRFLQKIDQKLAFRLARYKSGGKKLPDLVAAARSGSGQRTTAGKGMKAKSVKLKGTK